MDKLLRQITTHRCTTICLIEFLFNIVDITALPIKLLLNTANNEMVSHKTDNHCLLFRALCKILSILAIQDQSKIICLRVIFCPN